MRQTYKVLVILKGIWLFLSTFIERNIFVICYFLVSTVPEFCIYSNYFAENYLKRRKLATQKLKKYRVSRLETQQRPEV